MRLTDFSESLQPFLVRLFGARQARKVGKSKGDVAPGSGGKRLGARHHKQAYENKAIQPPENKGV